MAFRLALASALLCVVTACGDHDEEPGANADLTLTAPDGAPCEDPCPVARGLVSGCGHRFAYGTNWAWHHFGADFGGVAAWGQPGVAASRDALRAELAQMKADGTQVVRWWLFPRLFSDGITFDAAGSPAGIGGTLLADVEAALALAEEIDVHLVLTWFSFDAFAPSETISGVPVRGMRPLVVDGGATAALLERVVGPIADAVQASPHRGRLLAWDLINEPEWAMSGESLYGDPPFEAQAGLEAVSHAQMEGFLRAMRDALRARTSTPITVGSAAIKWPQAWTKLALDFYQLHYYGWVYEWFPFDTVTPDGVGLGDRPVVMGELPMQGLAAIPSRDRPALSLPELVSSLRSLGYAGALSWAYNDAAFPWDGSAMRTFPTAHACETEL